MLLYLQVVWLSKTCIFIVIYIMCLLFGSNIEHSSSSSTGNTKHTIFSSSHAKYYGLEVGINHTSSNIAVNGEMTQTQLAVIRDGSTKDKVHGGSVLLTINK